MKLGTKVTLPGSFLQNDSKQRYCDAAVKKFK